MPTLFEAAGIPQGWDGGKVSELRKKLRTCYINCSTQKLDGISQWSTIRDDLPGNRTEMLYNINTHRTSYRQKNAGIRRVAANSNIYLSLIFYGRQAR